MKQCFRISLHGCCFGPCGPGSPPWWRAALGCEWPQNGGREGGGGGLKDTQGGAGRLQAVKASTEQRGLGGTSLGRVFSFLNGPRRFKFSLVQSCQQGARGQSQGHGRGGARLGREACRNRHGERSLGGTTEFRGASAKKEQPARKGLFPPSQTSVRSGAQRVGTGWGLNCAPPALPASPVDTVTFSTGAPLPTGRPAEPQGTPGGGWSWPEAELCFSLYVRPMGKSDLPAGAQRG